MSAQMTTTRDALGALRLPWCVDAATRMIPIDISAEGQRTAEALQLRVRDIEDERVKEALRRQIANGEPSQIKIESILTDTKQAGKPPQIRDSKAFRIGADLTLMEGCHRTCATYLLCPPRFELRTALVPDEQAWPAYFDRRLRVA